MCIPKESIFLYVLFLDHDMDKYFVSVLNIILLTTELFEYLKTNFFTYCLAISYKLQGTKLSLFQQIQHYFELLEKQFYVTKSTRHHKT